MTRAIHVRAPCRLHFGMFSFGHTDRPQFGGVGVMVEPPAVEVAISRAAKFRVVGSLAERAKQFAEAAARAWKVPSLPACEIRVQSPSNHVGLGVGTQLALSVAAGLRRLLELPDVPAEELAAHMGRGVRSAVGTLGFQHGGLIVDAGHVPGQTIGRLAQRLAVPEGWRFVLVCPANQRGLAGTSEADAFGRLPPVPASVTRELWRITEEEMLPAVERADCRAFGDAVYRFGRMAGECFAAVQGGPFADARIERLVESIRDRGVAGVGQSSWGPTVFAVCASAAEGLALREWLRSEKEFAEGEITLARPKSQGACINEDFMSGGSLSLDPSHPMH